MSISITMKSSSAPAPSAYQTSPAAVFTSPFIGIGNHKLYWQQFSNR